VLAGIYNRISRFGISKQNGFFGCDAADTKGIAMIAKPVHSTVTSRTTMLSFSKRITKKLLNGVGLKVSRIKNDKVSIDSWNNWATCLELLKTQGFQPKTVFDIGVAGGTPDLYAAFPNAFYYLVDPTQESLPHMRAIAQKLNAKILHLALGEEECSLEIEVRPNDIGASSFFEEIGPLTGTRRYAVPVQRFDRVVTGFERPALCKIDVQGAEVRVLSGMGTRIDEFDAFIIEISTIATIKSAPEADRVFAFLDQHGFVIYDILSLNRRPLDSALAQIDVLFIKRNSQIRSDHRWRASAE
jgi:FkbM family methyltransferase